MLRHLLFVCILLSCNSNNIEHIPSPKTSKSLESKTPVIKAEIFSSNFRIKKGSNFSKAMREVGVDHTTIYHLAESSKKTYKLSKVPAQTEVYIEWENKQKNTAKLIELKLSPLKSVLYKKIAGSKSWEPSILKHPTNIKIETFHGTVSDSLWSSAQKAKMDSNLIVRLAEIMAWQVDFNREVRKNDKWRIVVESVRVGEKHIAWGNILAAEYINKSDSYKAIFFDRKDSNNKYYFPDGRSLKRMFLI